MKKIAFLLIAILIGTSVSFAQTKAKKVKVKANATLTASTSESSFGWVGKKFGGEHNGNITVKSGSLVMSKGVLTGGDFVIDMNSITCADISNAEYNAKLVGHLKADDFFGTEKFPTSMFKITKAVAKGNGAYDVTGDLTIKGTTKSITFPATVSVANGATTATAKFDVNRTDFGVKYGSKSFFDNLGDKYINDTFAVDVKLTAK